MKSPNELSFLPEDYLERKAQRRTNAICATLFLIILVTLVVTFVYDERLTRDVDGRHAAKEADYTLKAKRIEQVMQMQEKQRTMAIQAELTASLLEKVPRSFLLAEITNTMPAGVSLLDMTLESKKRAVAPPPDAAGGRSRSTFQQKKPTGAASGNKKDASPPQPQAPVYDVSLKITGIAGSDVQVAQFLTRLNQSKLLSDVNLLISDQYKGGEGQMRRFQIEMHVNPNADVASIAEKPKVTAVELVK